MAKSGVIGGGSSVPHLQIWWDTDRVDVQSNATRIRARLYLYSTVGPVSFSASKSGSLDGTSFTYTGGMRGTGYRLLSTKYIWIYHSSNGVGSRNISASFNLSITYSGSWMGTISTSGTIYPEKIDRMSNFTGASFSESIKDGTSGRLNLTVTDYPAGFYQWVGIYDGNTIVHDWGYNRVAPTYWNIYQDIARKILNRMGSQVKKDFTIRVYTYTGNGTGYIGYQSQTVTARVSSTLKPTISRNTTGIFGTGWDYTNGIYLQSVSRVNASFTSTAPYGASIASESIVIDGASYRGSDVTSGVVSSSGNVKVTYQTTDTRGAYNEWSTTVPFTPYRAPSITTFTAERNASTKSHVNLVIGGTFYTIGGRNKLNVTLQRRLMDGTFINIAGGATGLTMKDYRLTPTNTGVNISRGYEYRVIVTDTIGNSNRATRTVSTARVLMNLNEDKGIGIGKMHERGDLDISGAIYTNGMRLDMAPALTSIATNIVDTPAFWTNIPQGMYRVTPGTLPGQPESFGLMHVINDEYLNDWTAIFYSQGNSDIQPIYRKHGNSARNRDWVRIDGPETGSNSYGRWTKFNDGTMICETTVNIRSGSRTAYGALYYLYTTPGNWTFPQTFIDTPTISYASAHTNSFFTDSGVNSSRVSTIIAYYLTGSSNNSTTPLKVTAIGRWK